MVSPCMWTRVRVLTRVPCVRHCTRVLSSGSTSQQTAREREAALSAVNRRLAAEQQRSRIPTAAAGMAVAALVGYAGASRSSAGHWLARLLTYVFAPAHRLLPALRVASTAGDPDGRTASGRASVGTIAARGVSTTSEWGSCDGRWKRGATAAHARLYRGIRVCRTEVWLRFQARERWSRLLSRPLAEGCSGLTGAGAPLPNAVGVRADSVRRRGHLQRLTPETRSQERAANCCPSMADWQRWSSHVWTILRWVRSAEGRTNRRALNLHRLWTNASIKGPARAMLGQGPAISRAPYLDDLYDAGAVWVTAKSMR